MPVWLSYPSSQPAGGDGRGSDGEKATDARHCLFFFLPGNPGFVDYYETFLSTLRSLLDKVEETSAAHGSGRPVRFHILGRNLLGFDAGDDGGGQYGPAPFDLDTQIRAAGDAVAAARIDSAGGPRHGEPFDEVILSGHSVGSYIALEVFRRHTETGSPTPRLRAGILLFATLTHLAESPSGVGLRRLLQLPVIGAHAGTLADGFLRCWPTPALGWVVRTLLRFPPHAAAVTTRFLSNGVGVRQTIFLGRDELAHIREDTWADEVWEVAEEAEEAEEGEKGRAGSRAADDDDDDPPPKFIIFFGEDDHWVNNARRDQFIARREAHARRDGPAHKKGRARIVMDEKGLPHAFCIQHGEEVAEKVSTWIASILGDL